MKIKPIIGLAFSILSLSNSSKSSFKRAIKHIGIMTIKSAKMFMNSSGFMLEFGKVN